MDRAERVTIGSSRPRDLRNGKRSRVHFQGGGIRVTDRTLRVGYESHDLAEISGLRTARGHRQPLRVGVVVAEMAAFALAIGVSCYLRSAVFFGLMGLSALVAAGLLHARRMRRRGFELWAEYRGEAVLLLVMPDAETFGRVCRAIVRAKESGWAPEKRIGIDPIAAGPRSFR